MVVVYIFRVSLTLSILSNNDHAFKKVKSKLDIFKILKCLDYGFRKLSIIHSPVYME